MREFDVALAPCAAGARRRLRETGGQPRNYKNRFQPWQRLAISCAPVFRARRSSVSKASKVSLTGVPITKRPERTGGLRVRAGYPSRVGGLGKALFSALHSHHATKSMREKGYTDDA